MVAGLDAAGESILVSGSTPAAKLLQLMKVREMCASLCGVCAICPSPFTLLGILHFADGSTTEDGEVLTSSNPL